MCICVFAHLCGPCRQQNHRKKTNTQKTPSDGNCSTMIICVFVYLCIQQQNHSLNLVSGDAPHVVLPHPQGNQNRQRSTKNWWKWWRVVGRIFAQLEASVGQQYHHFGGKILTTFRQYGLLLFNHVRTHVL